MFLIQKNSSNTLVFTGSESSTLTANTQFLFVCQNRQSKQTVSFTAYNQSTAQTRYDMITFSETGTTANYTASTPYFSLSPGGFWDVQIYSQTNSYNLFPSGATELVEYDIALVQGYDLNSTTYFSGATITNHIFLRTSV